MPFFHLSSTYGDMFVKIWAWCVILNAYLVDVQVTSLCLPSAIIKHLHMASFWTSPSAIQPVSPCHINPDPTSWFWSSSIGLLHSGPSYRTFSVLTLFYPHYMSCPLQSFTSHLFYNAVIVITDHKELEYNERLPYTTLPTPTVQPLLNWKCFVP